MNSIFRNALCFFILATMGLAISGCNLLLSTEKLPDPSDQFEELITNGDFEILDEETGLPQGHNRNIGDGTTYSDDTTARSGRYSVYVGKTEGANNGFGAVTSMTDNLEAGSSYRITIWFKAPEMVGKDLERTPFYLRMGIRHMERLNRDWVHVDKSRFELNFGNTVAYIRPANPQSLDSNEWHPLSVTFQIPEDAERVGLIINMYNESTEHPVWFDDLSIQKID